jgi:hypothetical protein
VVLPQDLVVAEGSSARIPVGLLASSPDVGALNDSPLADLSALRPALATALFDLRYLTDSVKNVHDAKVSRRMSNLWYSDAVYSVQRRLMSLSVSLPVSTVSMTLIIDQACNLAALIYCEIGLRNISPHARIVSHLVTMLNYALAPHLSPTNIAANFYINSNLTPLMNILLWILMIGILAVADEAERVWFGIQLAQVTNMLDISSWVEARQALATIVWSDRIDELVRRRCIWEEMEEVSGKVLS